MLDLTDRLAVIVGGGRVAIRKARGLLDAGASKVRMVSPEFGQDVPSGIEKIVGRYEPRHLDGAALVFAATDSQETNDAIVREARRRGIFVNRADADDEEPGDFTTPALLREGPMTIAVSAAGAPGLAAMVRDQLAARFDPRWREMAQAMQTIRPAIRAASAMTPARRRDAFRDVATEEALSALSASDAEGLWRWLVQKYPELA